MQRSITVVGMLAVLAASAASRVDADEQAPPVGPWGNLFTRSHLVDSWGGARANAEANGLKIDSTLTQIEQGVVSGGKDEGWEYGGRFNLTVHLDSQKLGLWPGGFLAAEFESNWSESVNSNTGSLGTPNANHLFPVPSGSHGALPQLMFAQFVSPYLGAMIGKLDTMSGDANQFAHGKGDTQFMNLAFSINPVALAVPYSTLGTGLILLPTKDPHHALLQLSLLQAKGTATQSGFDDLSSDNLIFSAEGRVRTGFFGLTGHQLLAAWYSNARYTSIDQRLGLAVEYRGLEAKRDTWAVYYNFDQFVYETDASAGRGIGVFGRFGASEGNPNPIQYFVSAGIGAKGLYRSRPLDRFGIGFYYMDVNSLTFQGPNATRPVLDNECGLEAYYSVAVTPWLLLTPDIQVIEPSQDERLVRLGQREKVDIAVVLGTRLQLIF